MEKTMIMLVLNFISMSLFAQQNEQENSKAPIYAAVSFGYGNTFLRGYLGEIETANDDRGFGRNDGFAFSTFYYWAPQKLSGLGLGTGIKGFVPRPNNGGENETYSYSYYGVGIGIKDYFITKKFNDGFAFKANVTYGAGIDRMKYGNENRFENQIAYGLAYLGGFCCAFPLKNSKSAINIDFDYEYSSKNANITGQQNPVKFINHHVSLNFGLTF